MKFELKHFNCMQEVAATYLRRVGAVIEYAEDVDCALELLTRYIIPFIDIYYSVEFKSLVQLLYFLCA